MKDENETGSRLQDELTALRQRVAELEALEDEHRRAPEDLLDSAQLLETILDHTHMLVAYMDPQFNFVNVNRAYAEADERDPSFFPGKNHFDLYPNAENESIFGGVVQTGEPYFASAKPFEYAEHPERGVSYWDWSLMPIKSSEGQVTGLVFTVLDVTERVRAEEAMRESEERFRSIVEQSADGVVLIDEQGAIIEWNRAQEQITGMERSDVLGQPVWDVQFKLRPEEKRTTAARERLKAGTLEFLKGGQAPGYDQFQDWEMQHSDGSRKIIQASIVPIRTSKGFMVGSVNRDITERKGAEAALREAKELLEKTFASQRDAIFILDADVPPTIINCNPRAEEVFGYAAEEILGRTTSFLHVDEAALRRFQEHVHPAIEKQGYLHLRDFEMKRSDGTIFPTEHSVVPLSDERGEGIGCVSVVRDITDRKRADELAGIQRDLGLALSAAPDLDETLRLCVDAAIRASGLDCGGAYLVDETTGDLTLASHVGLPDDFVKSASHYAADSDSARLVMAGKPVYSRHQELGVPVDGARSREGLRAIAVIPIAYEGRLIACLNVASHTSDKVPRFARAALESISTQIGSAIARSKAEEALRVSELRFRSLVEQTTDAVFCYEYDPPIPTDLPVEEQVASLYRGILVECNDVCARSYGATRAEEVIGGKLTELYGTSSGSLDDFFRAFIENGCRAVDLEATQVLDDGTLRYYSNTGHGVMEDGMLLRVWGTFREVTERKRTEEEIRRRNEELVALNAIAETVSQSLDLADILEGALDKVLEIMRVEAGGIYLADEARQNVTLRAHRGVSEEFAREVGDLEIDEETVRRVEELGRAGKLVLVSELLLRDRTLLKAVTRAIAREKFRSYVQVLIRVKGSPVGLLVVASRDGRKFTAQEEELLSTIANQIGVGIENARLYQAEKWRLSELEALRQTTLDITKQLDLGVVLHSIASRAVELLRGTSGGLYLYRPEQDALEWAVAVGTGVAPIGSTLRRGDGLSGKVWETGQPLIVDDYSQWGGRTRIYEDHAFSAVVGVPVRFGDKFLGVLNVLREAPEKFSPGDAELLSLFAHQAAIAIENARLYEAVQARTMYLETLQEINATLRSTLPLNEVLETIVRRTTEALGYIGCTVALPDATGERLALGAAWGGRLVDAALRLTGFKLESFGLPLKVKDNVIAQAFHTGELQTSIGEPEGLAVGSEPSISPKIARGIERATGAKSAACVPLRVGERAVGVLVVLSPRVQLSDEERAMLLGLGDQAALAVENAKLYQEQAGRLAEMMALYETSLDVIGQLELPRLLRSIVERASNLLSTVGGAIWLYHPEDDELEVAVDHNSPVDQTGVRLKMGEGLAGKVIEVREALAVEDYRHWEGRSERFDHIDYAGVVGVPLRLKGGIIGVITVNEIGKPRRFDDHDIRLLTLLANQAAIAIENARLYEAVQARTMYLETLQQINATLRSTLPLKEVLETIVQGATEALGYTGTFVLLPDESTERLVLGAVWGHRFVDASLRLTGLRVGQFSLPLKVEENPMAQAFLTGELQTLSGTPEPIILGVEPAVSLGVASAIRRAMGAKGAACIPLRVGEKAVGVLVVISPRGQFADEEQAMLLGLADQAALAIENARLYEETKHRAGELAALYEVSLEVTGQLDLQSVLDAVAQRAIDLLGGPAGGLYLYDPQRQDLELIAGRFQERDYTGLRLALGEGACGRVAQTAQPLVVNGYRHWEGRSHQFVAEQNFNVLAVPITRGDTLLGALYVTGLPSQRRFGERDIRLATLFANQAAIAIENARLYEAQQQRSSELMALHETSLAVTSRLDLDSLLEVILTRAAKLLSASMGQIYLYRAERGDLVSAAAREVPSEFRGVVMKAGEGLAGRVLQTGEPLIVDDYDSWEGRSPGHSGYGFARTMGVPIRYGTEFLGVLILDRPLDNPEFTEADVNLLSLFANQAAVAIENARLFDQLERRIKQLAALHEVSLDVIATTDLSEALPTIVHKATQLLDAHGGGIYLSDSATRELEWRVGYGYDKDYTGMRLALGEGLAGRIAQSREPLLVDDYSNWDGRSPQWEDEPILAGLGVPLKRGDRLLGVLFVDRWVPGSFDENDLRLATLFANQAAIAIDNARLYEERTRRAEELATLYDMSLKVAGKTELSEVLPRVAYEAAQLLAADVGGIHLFDSEVQELELRVSFGYEKDYAGTRLVLGEGLAGKVAQSKEPMMVDDYSGWEGRSPQWDGEKLRSALAVPLLLGDQFLGVLFLGRQLPRAFDDNDLQLATLFANQTAVAIENARLVEEITSHGKDLQRLSTQLIRAQEEERKRISQELHDEMGQALTAMSINLAVIEKELSSDLASALGQRLAETNGLIAQTLDQMRDLALDLRPSMLDDLGLVPTLRWYVKRYAARLNIDVEFEAINLEERLHAETETVLYRTVQEALTNVARHAHASRVDVRLKRGDSSVTVSVEDDGQGFDIEKVGERELPERGAGLLGIRERAASLGGSFSVQSVEGQGTQLSIEIPLGRSRPQ